MKTKKGFTLIELMIVVAIIGMIAAIAIPSMEKVREKVRETQAKAKAKDAQGEIPLFARVISVGEGGSGETDRSNSIAAVIQIEEKPEPILAVADDYHYMTIARAKAILQAAASQQGSAVEVLVELKGAYNEKGEFVMKHIKLGKLEVEF